jgi:hypothetical protein
MSTVSRRPAPAMILAARRAVGSGISRLIYIGDGVKHSSELGLISCKKRSWFFLLWKFTSSLHPRLAVKGKVGLLLPVGLGVICKVEMDMAMAHWG